MDQVHVIRQKVLIEGQSIRSVAREMGVGRNTIKKYLKLSEPVRVVHQKKSSPVKEMVAPRIDQILEEWHDRTTHKQRITGTRVHRQLVEVLEYLAEGMPNRHIAEERNVGLPTVKRYVDHAISKLGVSDRTQATVKGLERGRLPIGCQASRALLLAEGASRTSKEFL